MKKLRQCALWLTMILIISQMTACERAKDIATPVGEYLNGTLIFSEGNFSEGDGKVDFLKKGESSLVPDVFALENNTPVGGIIQSARKYDNLIYIVTNNNDFVRVVEAATMKLKFSIQEGLQNPIDVAVINGKIYVTNWGPIADAFGDNPRSFIAVYNAQNGSFLRKIDLNIRPHGIWAYSRSKVFVAGAGSNKLLVVDSNNDTLAGEVDLGAAQGPQRMEIDANGKLWVACSGGQLVRLNPVNQSIEATLDVGLASFPVRIATDKEHIFYFNGNRVFRLPVDANQAPSTPFLVVDGINSLYGIGADQTTGFLYVGEQVFTQAGRVRLYDKDGIQKEEHTAGKAPHTFIVQ